MDFLKNFSRSSSDPQKLALTVKGLMLMAVPMIVIMGKQFGYEWSDTVIAVQIGAIFEVIAVFLTLVGLLRKLMYLTRELLKK